MCREARQVAHFRLMRIEQQLKDALNVTTNADLELALLRDDGKNAGLIKQFQTSHEDFAAASELFDAACNLQRSRIQDQ